MKETLREIKIVSLLLLGVICFGIVASLVAQTAKQPRMINIEEYTRLRAELSRDIDALKQRIEKLESAVPAGNINVYEVDTLAGRLRCRSCVQVEEKPLEKER